MNPVTPRTTRLLRAVDLAAFRHALVDLALEGELADARSRVVIVPTRAAAAQFVRSLEQRALPGRAAIALPDLITPRELVTHLATRLPALPPSLSSAEREVLMGVACRAAAEQGQQPPFRVRPGLVAEIVRFYDDLRRRQKDVHDFERLALGMLEPGAELDRGAARLVEQTRFMVAAFREFEARCADAGADDHARRRMLLTLPADPPWRHIVVAVGDEAHDRFGLCAADWDLLARLPGLERLDVVTTDTLLAGEPHERMHRLLPGIDEVRVDAGAAVALPTLLVPDADARVHLSRDREEEVAAFARWAKAAVRTGEQQLDRIALVVQQPLPYLYVTRELLRSAGVPLQMFDALPLAAEPFAAALDLVVTFVSTNFARQPAIALLRSPHFRVSQVDASAVEAGDIAALDRRLAESGYLGELPVLERFVDEWRATAADADVTRALRAAERTMAHARALATLREAAPAAQQLDVLLAFITSHVASPTGDPRIDARERRARSAIQHTLAALRDAFARFDAHPRPFDEIAASIRRWIEGHTFAPRDGDAGVHLVDAESARFGDFDAVQLAGVVDGEWPERPRRNVFYGSEILRQLGWPAESERRDAARARFAELLRLPRIHLRVSLFNLENESVVTPSAVLDELARTALPTRQTGASAMGIFEHEALGFDPPCLDHLAPAAAQWAGRRVAQLPMRRDRAFRGYTDAYKAPAYSLSALERYQDCPFRFFAANVLRIEEEPEDRSSLTPRRRGQLLHAILQRFFEEWDATRAGAVTPDTIAAARTLFERVAEPFLATLPESEAALERTRLFGSPISPGIADTVLDLEATRADGAVRERWLEYRLDGMFALGDGGPPVSLRGVADRVDLLDGRRLRVVDYKSGRAPAPSRALQAPIYALCAQERLAARDRQPWEIAEAAYVSLAGRRPFVPVIAADDPAVDRAAALDAARQRLRHALTSLEQGIFPPRPHDTTLCRTCTYETVCRKDYVGDE